MDRVSADLKQRVRRENQRVCICVFVHLYVCIVRVARELYQGRTEIGGKAPADCPRLHLCFRVPSVAIANSAQRDFTLACVEDFFCLLRQPVPPNRI